MTCSASEFARQVLSCLAAPLPVAHADLTEGSSAKSVVREFFSARHAGRVVKNGSHGFASFATFCSTYSFQALFLLYIPLFSVSRVLQRGGSGG